MLFAKSKADSADFSKSVTLSGHHEEVFLGAVEVIGSTGRAQLEALGLEGSFSYEQLDKVVRLAAAIHDIGKGTDAFGAVLDGRARSAGLRHEWVSVWWLNQATIRDWLLPAVDGDEMLWTAVMVAVASHHLRPPWDGEFNFPTPIKLLVEDEEFKKSLNQIHHWFDLHEPPVDLPTDVYLGPAAAGKIRKWYSDIRDEIDERFDEYEEEHPHWRRFVASAKASLIAADVAGSALWERLSDPSERVAWVRYALTQEVPAPEVQAIADDRLDGNEPFPFQQAIADSTGNVTLVEAGCGAGKTVAAYLWAAKQHAGRRLWFCYPTTGTATEGFAGYLVDPDNVTRPGAELFHSRSEFDRLRLMKTPAELGRTDSSGDEERDTEIRIQSLRAWETRINCCTVDTVLGLLQNQRTGIYAWPSIAQSAIVFDEIHCYDDKLFSVFLEFLRQVPGIPVLLMSASLPKARKAAIEAACHGRTFVNPPCDAVSEQTKRYVYSGGGQLTARDDAIRMVDKAISEKKEKGERVLWISNTVKRARRVAEDLSFVEPKVYHSRFKYRDRCDRHVEVIELFKRESTGIATTTQVAEMSLDLKTATLLVTELAPIPSMIQRLGRLNRSAHFDEDPQPKSFVVIEPQNDGAFSPRPYAEEELELARKWLKSLGSQPLSQKDLVERWQQLDNTPVVEHGEPAWFADNLTPNANNSIREGAFGVTVIDQADVSEIRDKADATAYALPMDQPPSRNCLVGRCRGFPVASAGSLQYCQKMGGEWATFQCE